MSMLDAKLRRTFGTALDETPQTTLPLWRLEMRLREREQRFQQAEEAYRKAEKALWQARADVETRRRQYEER